MRKSIKMLLMICRGKKSIWNKTTQKWIKHLCRNAKMLYYWAKESRHAHSKRANAHGGWKKGLPERVGLNKWVSGLSYDYTAILILFIGICNTYNIQSRCQSACINACILLSMMEILWTDNLSCSTYHSKRCWWLNRRNVNINNFVSSRHDRAYLHSSRYIPYLFYRGTYFTFLKGVNPCNTFFTHVIITIISP